MNLSTITFMALVEFRTTFFAADSVHPSMWVLRWFLIVVEGSRVPGAFFKVVKYWEAGVHEDLWKWR